MNDRDARLGAVQILAVLVLFLNGCTLTVGTNPDAYSFPSEEVFEVTPGTSVSVTNSYTAAERVELGSRVYCDLAQFTHTAITMVQRELSSKDLRMSPTGDKTIILRMAYPNWVRGTWTMKGRVTLQAELGNGEKLSVDGESQTGGNVMRAFNGAILRAVTGLLKDPTLAAYLNATTADGDEKTGL